MSCEECEALRARVEALELDAGFAAGKCKEGLHAVQVVVRESVVETLVASSGDVGERPLGFINREVLFACPHCDRLFAPSAQEPIEEVQVDPAVLKDVRSSQGVTVDVEAEEEEGDGREDESGLFRW
jgi:hypothetical protein